MCDLHWEVVMYMFLWSQLGYDYIDFRHFFFSYQIDEDVRVLPCHKSHHFHQRLLLLVWFLFCYYYIFLCAFLFIIEFIQSRRCVDEWLRANATCPFCKKSVKPADGLFLYINCQYAYFWICIQNQPRTPEQATMCSPVWFEWFK